MLVLGGSDQHSERARESGELGREEGTLFIAGTAGACTANMQMGLCSLLLGRREGKGRAHYVPPLPPLHCAEALLLPALLTFLCMLAVMATT